MFQLQYNDQERSDEIICDTIFNLAEDFDSAVAKWPSFNV